MRTILLIALLTLLIGISLAQTMNEMIVIRQAEFRQDQIIRQDRIDRMGRICAGLLILTDLTGLKFESNNGVVDVSHEPGRYMVFVSEGERVLDVYRDGFLPLEIILNQYGIYGLKSGQVYELRITAKDREVDSLPVVFNVTPDDARIRVGSLTFTSGRAQQLPKGENEVIIEKEGYRPIREKINVDNNSVFFSFNLQEIEPVLVNIRSNPQNAMIMIDNADRGVTNRDLWLYPGRYEVQLSLSGHININEAIEVKETGTNTFNWNLTKNIGTFNFTVNPANAELLINNEKQTQMRGIEMPPGLYRIEVKAAGHHSESERIELKLGETVNKTYNLKAMTGNLLLEVFPTNAEVEIISGGRTVRKVSGSSRVTDLFVGEYTLKASASGFKSGEYRVTIRENETARQSIALEEGADILDNMVLVEGGRFQMGSNDGRDNEKPVHSVTVSSFYIGKYPVTIKEFSDFIGSSGYRTTAEQLGTVRWWDGSKWTDKSGITWRDDVQGNRRGSNETNHPVLYVSWYDAIEYCNWLSSKEGLTPVYTINKNRQDPNNRSSLDNLKWTVTVNWSANGYRLPTEAEWEYAARGGNKSRGFTYSGSNNIGDVAWYSANSGRKTHPVGNKKSNELGIYDMSGNVWEWCWDWYGSYTSGAKTNPRGPQSGSSRVLRGGSWLSSASRCRVGPRSHDYPAYRSYRHFGFRVARTLN